MIMLTLDCFAFARNDGIIKNICNDDKNNIRNDK